MIRRPVLFRAILIALLAVSGAACDTVPSYGPEERRSTPPAREPEPVRATAPQPPASPPKVEDPVPAVREWSKAEQDFERGIQSYEDGDYRSAGRQFQSALALGLPALAVQARAHKYLAFIACAAGQQRPCRDEFRMAFEADPAFDLTPAEAGHPVWGPVFRGVKRDMAKAKPK